MTLAVDQPTVTFEEAESAEPSQNETESQPGNAAPAQLTMPTTVELVQHAQADVASASEVDTQTNEAVAVNNDLATSVSVNTEPNTDADPGVIEDETAEHDGDEDYVPSDEEEETVDQANVVEEQENVQARQPQEMGVGKRRYDCNQCSKTFHKVGLLREHVKSHKGTVDYNLHVTKNYSKLNRFLQLVYLKPPISGCYCSIFTRYSILLCRTPISVWILW